MPKLELRNTSHGLAIFDTDDLVSKPLIQFPVKLIPLIIKGLRTVYENPDR